MKIHGTALFGKIKVMMKSTNSKTFFMNDCRVVFGKFYAEVLLGGQTCQIIIFRNIP